MNFRGYTDVRYAVYLRDIIACGGVYSMNAGGMNDYDYDDYA